MHARSRAARSRAAATLAAFALTGTALAVEVDGTLTFPHGFVPAMMVYARDLDSAKLHSVSTRESQISFKLELPPGRYVFFAEPSQAGAPEIYGAYTENVLCKARKATDPCDDHTLVVYTAGTKSAAPAISDWAIPDAQAEEFDKVLGTRPETSPQELGAPHFSEYPVKAGDVDSGAPAAPPALDFSGTSLAAEQQERIQELVKAGASFAGSVAVAELSCGANCVAAVFVDLLNGKVHAPAALAQIVQDLPCRAEESILFRRNSRLFSVTRRHDGGVSTQYFIWKPESSSLVQTAEYQRAEERFCTQAPHEG